MNVVFKGVAIDVGTATSIIWAEILFLAEIICGTPKDDCHEFATCKDTGPGEHECTCKPWYTGDGKSCTGINACFKEN